MTAHRIENRPGDVFTKSFSAELDANKFADLIVKECATFMDEYADRTGNDLLEHFGVDV